MPPCSCARSATAILISIVNITNEPPELRLRGHLRSGDSIELYEIVNRYHIGTNYSCAESILLGCEEYYHLHLPEQARKLFTLLGSGMQTGLSCCGALTAGTAILGLMTTPDGAWNSDNPVGAALVDELTNVFGQFETLWCDELRGLEIDGYEDPCYCVVETVAKKLQELLARCEEEIPHAE